MFPRLLPLSFVACATTRWGHAELTQASPTRTIEITASHSAFTPNAIAVNTGEVVRLRFIRTTSRSCAREVVISLDGAHQIRRELPVDVPVDVALHFDRPGELGFSCGMAMLGGTIDVKPGR